MSQSSSTFLRPAFEPSTRFKLLCPVGACLDIPAGYFVPGRRGEMILNAGMGRMNAVVATGNIGKTTLLLYVAGTTLSRLMYGGCQLGLSKYDTEIMSHIDREIELLQSLEGLQDKDLLAESLYVISDKSKMYADTWFDLYKQFIEAKKALPKSQWVETPFFDYDGKSTLKVIPPSINMIDSISQLETKHAQDLREDNTLGDSEMNMLSARQGLYKSHIFNALPVLANSGNDYVFMVGQYKTDTIQIASGPGTPPPQKKLQFMKPGEKIVGVPGQFYFLLQGVYNMEHITQLIQDKTRTPEYPSNPHASEADMDLNVVRVRNIRGKAGPTGPAQEIVISQREGVLPSLTEFHYLRSDRKYFGMEGTNVNYRMSLYPSLSLTRPTVRSKLDADPMLRRAVNITSELAQMMQFMPQFQPLMCTPKELFDDLKAQGYDWDEILGGTRGWYTYPNSYDTDLKHLSTLDLLRMRKGLYKPYWKQ